MTNHQITLSNQPTSPTSLSTWMKRTGLPGKATVLVEKITHAATGFCSEANSLELLIEEAKERAEKPWNQRLPED